MTSRFVPHRDGRRLAASWGLAALLCSAHTFAQEQVELAWEAPPECPQEAAVRQKIRTLAGDAWHTTERVRAQGRIERVDGRYRLTVRVHEGDAAKERTIAADSCVDLAGAAAVTLGLLLGRGATPADAGATTAGGAGTAATGGAGTAATGGAGTQARGGSSGDASARASGAGAAGAKQGADSATKPEARESDADEADADSSSTRADDVESGGSAGSVHALLRAPVLTLDLARIPEPSLGFGAGLGARYAEWRLVASARILLDQTLWSEDFPDVGSRVSRFAAELAVCRGFRSDSFELAPCLTVGLDHLTARGTGPPNITRHTQRTTSVLLGGAAAAHYYFTDWMALFAGAGLAVATSRATLTVEGLGEVGHAGLVQVSVGIGPEWIF